MAGGCGLLEIYRVFHPDMSISISAEENSISQ
jgi:hypothetical protein